ncbi:MAG: hypothetical protein ABF289_02300, partial [Clostridiales bacterium]
GSLILESILKLFYINITLKDKHETIFIKKNKITLGEIFACREFNNKYFNRDITRTNYQTNDLNDIINDNNFNQFEIENSFTITTKIRNTVSHSLNWNSQFIDYFDIFHKHIINSIFYVIKEQY